MGKTNARFGMLSFTLRYILSGAIHRPYSFLQGVEALQVG